MIRKIGKATFHTVLVLGFLFLVCVLLEVVFAVPISGTIEERLGSFTGPVGGTAQDDNVKASLDLAHTDLDSVIRNQGLLGTTTGSVFYVDSGTAGSTGISWATAVATVEAAVALCTAGAGDIILIAPGHTETLGAGADGVDLDKANLTVIGLGTGEARPLFDYDTNTDEFVIGADNVAVYNCQFKANVTDVAHAIDVEANCENFIIDGCRFYVETTGTDEFTDAIETADGSDNGRITNCRFEQGAGGADTAISFVGSDYIEISGNIINGDYAVAGIESLTTAAIMAVIKDNVIFNGTVGGDAGLNTVCCITMKSDTTGYILNNTCFANVVSPEDAIVAADMYAAGNTYSENEQVGGSELIGRDKNTDILAALGVSMADGTTRGRVVYVDSGETTAIEDGLTWATAYDTLDEGINACTASNGDTIFVAPGHAETFTAADGWDADVIGITIIGLGNGSNRPTFTFNNANAEVAVGADNVTIKNLRFLCSVTGVLMGVSVEDGVDYLLMENCEWNEVGDATGTDEFVEALNFDNANIGCTIRNCRFIAKAAGASAAIFLDADTDQLTIENCDIRGDYSTACIASDTAASTNILIRNNILINGSLVGDGGLNAVAAISLIDATAGLICDNRICSDVATGLLMRVADDCVFMNNYITDDDGDEFSGVTEDTSASITAFSDG